MKEIKFDYNKNIDDKEAEEILDNLIEVKKAYEQRREGIVEIINPLRTKELLFAEENLKRIFKTGMQKLTEISNTFTMTSEQSQSLTEKSLLKTRRCSLKSSGEQTILKFFRKQTEPFKLT